MFPVSAPYCNASLTIMASGYDKPHFKVPHIEDSKKRVRVLFGGKIVVDAYKPKLVYATIAPDNQTDSSPPHLLAGSTLTILFISSLCQTCHLLCCVGPTRPNQKKAQKSMI